MDADEVLAVENAVLVLTGRIDHLYRIVLVAEAEDLAECVLNGGVVGVHKVSVDELHGEGALA
jgi:hypothetical protein